MLVSFYQIISDTYIMIIRPEAVEHWAYGLCFLVAHQSVVVGYFFPLLLLGLFLFNLDRFSLPLWRYITLLGLGFQVCINSYTAYLLDFSAHTSLRITFASYDFGFFSSAFIINLDSKSIFFYILVPFILFLAALSIRPEYRRRKQAYFIILVLDFILVSFFTAFDLLHFYTALELSIWPMFAFISIWGSRNRKSNAAYIYFFFSMFASVLFLIAIIMIALKTGSTILVDLYEPITVDKVLDNTLGSRMSELFDPFEQTIIFVCLFMSLAIKLPIFPFHVWLPEVHAEASTSGSVILASLYLKMAGFGMFQFVLPFFPIGYAAFRPFGLLLGTLGLIYCSIVLFRQIDIKKFIAYTSVLHMNMMVIAIFSCSSTGFMGAYFSMLVHTFTSALLFFVAGMIYDRYHTRIVFYMDGLSSRSPNMAMIFYIALLTNLGFPLMGMFPAELAMIEGIYEGTSLLVAILSAAGASIAAVAHFYFLNRFLKGPLSYDYKYFERTMDLRYPNLPEIENWDCVSSEYYYILPLVILVFQTNFMSGFYFSMLVNSMNALFIILSGF